MEAITIAYVVAVVQAAMTNQAREYIPDVRREGLAEVDVTEAVG